MPRQGIPRAVIAEVADVLASHYYSHNMIDNLLIRCGAPGDPPGGTLINKITNWLSWANDDPSVDPFTLLGCILNEFMERETEDPAWLQRRERINRILARYSLSYHQDGRIIGGTSGPPSRTLQEIIRGRDWPAIELEFARALDSVESDPPTAVTAACAIVESLCKVYIEDEGLDTPSDQSIKPLWRVVQGHLQLHPGSVEDHDLRKILGGLSSILDGVGALRTHGGSAHGHGSEHRPLQAHQARLAVNAAHTLVTFVIEVWDQRRSRC